AVNGTLEDALVDVVLVIAGDAGVSVAAAAGAAGVSVAAAAGAAGVSVATGVGVSVPPHALNIMLVITMSATIMNPSLEDFIVRNYPPYLIVACVCPILTRCKDRVPRWPITHEGSSQNALLHLVIR